MPVTDAIACTAGARTVGINVEFEQREFIVFATGRMPTGSTRYEAPTSVGRGSVPSRSTRRS